MERQAFALINEARRAQGCPLLEWNDTAAAVARAAGGAPQAGLPRAMAVTPLVRWDEATGMLARLGVEMLDPSYASASQIESATTQLQPTERPGAGAAAMPP